MRIVVVGATGNVGTSVLEALGRDDSVSSILGLARRLPHSAARYAKTEFAAANVVSADLVPYFAGADCVIHLAWAIQPSRDQDLLWTINVEGSSNVFAAAAKAGVGSLVVASSIGAYSPGAKRRVDESWPTGGIASSWYSRHKAQQERRLDAFEAEHRGIRVVRLRPGLIMKRDSAEEVRRLFFGPFLPSPLAKPGRLRVLPHVPGAVVQLVHSLDVGEAYRLAATRDVRGAFNIAAEPELDGQRLAQALGARAVTIPAKLARAAVGVAWLLRLQPTSPDWLDLALGAPLLDCTRARDVLGWEPTRDGIETVRELLHGLADRAGGDTPPLRAGDRRAELGAGVGGKPV
ncbi:MAG TPA: NAD-dependent epimerase/dehydratase family protein [Gaiellaceae bacterium]|nr:NAD-dependent epimerase/dehydratase family protein [Gaiellaceae bacterium]